MKLRHESGSHGYWSLCRLTSSAAPSPVRPDRMVSDDCPTTVVVQLSRHGARRPAVTASKNSIAAAVDATAQVLAKSTGVPSHAIPDGKSSWAIASAMSRVADLSPVSLLNDGSQFLAGCFGGLPLPPDPAQP